jgi:hypothetical protein
MELWQSVITRGAGLCGTINFNSVTGRGRVGATGLEQPGWSMALACMVIIGGSLLAGVGRNRQATGKSPRYNCASDTLLQKAAVYSCSE